MSHLNLDKVVDELRIDLLVLAKQISAGASVEIQTAQLVKILDQVTSLKTRGEKEA